MTYCQSINIALEAVTVTMLAILLVASHLQRPRDLRIRLLMASIALMLVTTCGDLFAWLFTEIDEPLQLLLANGGNLACYIGGAFGYTFFAFLVCIAITHRTSPEGRGARAALSVASFIGTVNLVLALTNCFTGVFYTIDATNNFTWGPWRILPDNLLLAQLVFVLAAALFNRRESVARTVIHWLTLAGVPIAAVCTENGAQTLMLIYPAIAISLLVIYLGFVFEQRWEVERLERELAESKGQALAGQIKPHFISNTLLAIQQLTTQDPALACKTMQTFSAYLRDNYETLDSTELIDFTSELERAKRYVAIEQVDPASNVEVVYDLGPVDFRVPPLSLQPLVENAVRHGVGPKPEGGTVTISTSETADAWFVTVADDGVGFDADEGERERPSRRTGAEGDAGAAAGDKPHQGTRLSKRRSVALNNVRTRLELMCQGTLTIESRPGNTHVTMVIPKETGDHEVSRRR